MGFTKSVGCWALALLAALSALIVTIGCGPEQVTGEACRAVFGDLVISELMAAPDGSPDTGREWFEIYNAGSEPQVLNRLVVQSLKVGDDGEPVTCVSEEDCPSATCSDSGLCVKEHWIRGVGALPPRSYFVLGDGIVPQGAGSIDEAPIDYSYEIYKSHENLGDLTNEKGGLRLECLGREIDTLWYGTSTGLPAPSDEEGRSFSFDGGVAPDALRNNDPGLWCTGGDPYDTVNLGTPGAPNILCGFATCEESGGMRDVIAPKAGDLIISEILTDQAGSGSDGEWVELYVAASSAVDLNGITLIHETAAGSRRSFQVTGVPCKPVQPGQFALVAASADPAGDGTVTPDVVLSDMDFFGSGVSLTLKRGFLVIDTANLPEGDEGHSVEFDGGASPNDQLNDDAKNWCFGGAAPYDFDADNFGTPGRTNTNCGLVSCLDGTVARSTVKPGPGDLVLTELMPNPDGTDADREWIELYVTASAPVDLNGLVVAKTSNVTMVVDPACVSAQPGDYVVIGGAANPNLTVDVVLPRLSMSTSRATIELRSGLDIVDAADLPPAGNAHSLALDGGVAPTTASNDTSFTWCGGTQAYGGGTEFGTPGTANTGCGLVSCQGSGGPRPPVRPALGDLLITELLLDPTGNDSGKEWVEVFVTGSSVVDLNGLIVSKSTNGSIVSDPTCLPAQPGSYYVVGASDVLADNGNLNVDAVAPGMAMTSTAATVQLTIGPDLIDSAVVPPAVSGTSTSLSSATLNDAGNDDPTNFCASLTTGVFDDVGSPGLANEVCP